MLEPMDIEPPSDIVTRAPPPPRNVEFAVYPPGYASSNARTVPHRVAAAARQRRSDIHYERRGARMTRGVIVPYGETPMEVEDIDEQYHDEL